MMKKITLLVVAVLLGMAVHAQFHVTSNHGDIEDGDVLTFTGLDKNDSSIEYEIHNDSDEPIDMRVRMVSFENTDGEDFEICLGQCYYKVIENTTYPLALGGYVTIEPGESQEEGAEGDHFWNKALGTNPEEDVTYVIQFEQLDPSHSYATETLEFTYVFEYDELSVENHNQEVDVQILNTVTQDGELKIENKESINLEIYNLIGQKVKTAKFNSGKNTIDVSNLSSQVYLARFSNDKGQTFTKKIIVR